MCVVAAQRQLAALGKTNSSRHRDEQDERIISLFFLTTTAASSSCSVRARAPCESESSVLVQRLALRSSPVRAAFLLIAQPVVDRSSSYVEFKSEFCSDFPADSPMKKITKSRQGGISNNDVVGFFCLRKIRLSSVLHHRKEHNSRPKQHFRAFRFVFGEDMAFIKFPDLILNISSVLNF